MGRDAQVGTEPLRTESQALLGLGLLVKTPVKHGTVAHLQDPVLDFLRTYQDMMTTSPPSIQHCPDDLESREGSLPPALV